MVSALEALNKLYARTWVRVPLTTGGVFTGNKLFSLTIQAPMPTSVPYAPIIELKSYQGHM